MPLAVPGEECGSGSLSVARLSLAQSWVFGSGIIVFAYLPLLVGIKRMMHGIEGCFRGKCPCLHALRASEDG
jgi:hypothetical protein